MPQSTREKTGSPQESAFGSFEIKAEPFSTCDRLLDFFESFTFRFGSFEFLELELEWFSSESETLKIFVDRRLDFDLGTFKSFTFCTRTFGSFEFLELESEWFFSESETSQIVEVGLFCCRILGSLVFKVLLSFLIDRVKGIVYVESNNISPTYILKS